jgi:hypothetical protein
MRPLYQMGAAETFASLNLKVLSDFLYGNEASTEISQISGRGYTNVSRNETFGQWEVGRGSEAVEIFPNTDVKPEQRQVLDALFPFHGQLPQRRSLRP